LKAYFFSQDGFEDFDDIYSDNTSETKISDANGIDNPNEFSDGEDAGAWIENDEYYDPSYNSTTTSDSSGNTYITNNYNGDYGYSSRFRRFDNRIPGYSYYDPFYTNVGYYSPNAWGYGRSFRGKGWNVGFNNGWGNNGWGNNGWGNNGWGNNSFAYNQGFRDGVYSSNGSDGNSNNNSRYYGRRGSRGSGTRSSSNYGDRRLNSRTSNSSGIIQNTNAFAGTQSVGSSIRTARSVIPAVSSTRKAQVKVSPVGTPVRTSRPERSTTTNRVGDRRATNVSSRSEGVSSTPSTTRTSPGVSSSNPRRASPARPSTTPIRKSIGKPSRRTVGSSPIRAAPNRVIPTRTSPTRTSPTRTSPIRTRPSRTTPVRTRPIRTTPSRTTPSRSSRSSGSSRTSSPSRSKSSPSRGGSSGSSRGSSSRGGKR